jgi:hypothetical protein
MGEEGMLENKFKIMGMLVRGSRKKGNLANSSE